MHESTTPTHRALLTLCSALLAAFAACHSDSANMAPAVATTIAANAGSDHQIDTAGRSLAQMVSVHVSDQYGNAVAGATVTWAVVSGGGSVAAPTSVTNMNGDAAATWTLGTTIGVNTLSATLASGVSFMLHATGISGSISTIVKVSGDVQSVAAGAMTQPLMVQIIDSFGNVEAGKTVTWAVANPNGGALSATTSTTDSNGLSLVTFTTGPTPSTYSITATAGGLSAVAFAVRGM